VLEHLDQLQIKPAFRTRGGGGSPPAIPLRPEDREALRRRITFQPHLYVAQEWVDLSTAPSWQGGTLLARPVALRVYLVASGDSYQVLAGGLARVAAEAGARSVSMQRGGASKDAWVLSDGPVVDDSLLEAGRVELRRVGNNLPSRMADNFFWLGRYVERADAICRLLRSAISRFSTATGGSASPALSPILATLRRQGQFEALVEPVEPAREEEAFETELRAAIFSGRRGSLRHTADQMLRLTQLVRDRSSHDCWRVIRQMHERLSRPTLPGGMPAAETVAFLNQMVLRLASFHGLAMENMTRAQGWRFLDMGHRIERSIYGCAFLESALSSPVAADASVLESVLEVMDNAITYRSRYNLLPHIAAVYDLVLLDETNPRALVFQLQQLLAHLDHLPREQDSPLPTPAQRALLGALTRLRLCDPGELGRCPGNWLATEVAGAIQQAGRAAPAVSDALAVSYFAHSIPPRPAGEHSIRG
jgi:uncharacterized alpha-E superfamily protein